MSSSIRRNKTESDTNDNNGDGSSGGVGKFVEILVDDIENMTDKKLVQGLVNKLYTKGKEKKSNLQLKYKQELLVDVVVLLSTEKF